MAALPHPPPELIKDAITEILQHLPPNEPVHLIHASLVCKLWRRILSDPAFLRRYSRFHQTPPLLRLFTGSHCFDRIPGFYPTTDASPFRQAVLDHRSYFHLDCRHGRVLLKKPKTSHLFVWDPITDDLEDVQVLCIQWLSAAVLCAATNCDHYDCHGGPFLVICMEQEHTYDVYSTGRIVRVCTYSLQVGAWSTSVSVQVSRKSFVNQSRGAIVEHEIYFELGWGDAILKYDFVKHHLSVIDTPDSYKHGIVLMLTHDGFLGLSGTKDSNLYLWSRKANSEGVEGWVQSRVIDLQPLLHVFLEETGGASPLLPVADPFIETIATCFTEHERVIFITTSVGDFIIELKTGRARRLGKLGTHYRVIPFMSFYTPGCACSKLPLPAVTN